MAKTFKELRDDAYRNIFMSTKYFGEQLVKVENLRWREDVAAWDQAVSDAILAGDFFYGTISDDMEVDGAFDDGQSYDRTETIVLQCLKDPAARDKDNNLIGGIDKPNLHLGIVRLEGDRDPLGIPYMFQREMKGNTETLWRLIFSRDIHAIQGLPT